MSNKSKLTLVVDGNWLLMSRLAILRMKIKDEETLVKEMKLMMIKSMNKLIRDIPEIDNIIFVADGGSWRNKINIPSFLEKDNITYKGNREKDKDLDWDKIFSGYDEFVTTLKECGICVSREQYVEGDDWVAYWSNLLNSKDINCMIWSKDRDLTQLVKINPQSKCFTVCWNKDSITVKNTYSDNPDDMDFFFNSYDANMNQKLFDLLCSKAKIVNRINPMDVVIEKIIRGDLGDNVLPIVYKKSKTSEKLFRVSMKELDFSIDITDIDDIENYVDALLEKKSWIGKATASHDEIIEHFIYNKQLVWLDKTQYPDDIISKMKLYRLTPPNKNLCIAEQKIQAEKNDVMSILENI